MKKKISIEKCFLFLFFIFCNIINSSAEERIWNISGNVTDQKGEPLIGASVIVKGTTNGTITDIDGNFSINIPEDKKTLLISYISFVSQEITCNGEKFVKITLKEETNTLNEVVVIGYGTQKKVNLTGSVSQIDSEVLENRPAANLTRGLQGTIPNLNIVMADGSPTRKATYNVRGTTSIGARGKCSGIDRWY